jgi:hypothetical protein
VFDEVSFHNNQQSAGFSVNSEEGHWNTGRKGGNEMSPNLGYHIRPKEGYVPVAPVDTLIDLRNSISLILAKSVSTSNVIITKSPPPDNAKSILSFPICCTRLTT